MDNKSKTSEQMPKPIPSVRKSDPPLKKDFLRKGKKIKDAAGRRKAAASKASTER